jgi:hypothetical protein
MKRILATSALSAMLTAAMFVFGGCNAQLSPNVKRDIDAKMRAQQGAIQGCYQTAVGGKIGPETPKGSVTLSFSVLPSGKATDVKVKSSQLKSKTLEACIVQHAKKLALTHKPDRRVMVTYPLDFSADWK